MQPRAPLATTSFCAGIHPEVEECDNTLEVTGGAARVNADDKYLVGLLPDHIKAVGVAMRVQRPHLLGIRTAVVEDGWDVDTSLHAVQIQSVMEQTAHPSEYGDIMSLPNDSDLDCDLSLVAVANKLNINNGAEVAFKIPTTNTQHHPRFSKLPSMARSIQRS